MAAEWRRPGRIDFLHCKCLATNLLASGGGAVDFIVNNASNASRVISGGAIRVHCQQYANNQLVMYVLPVIRPEGRL
jgi:hypothetical protein